MKTILFFPQLLLIASAVLLRAAVGQNITPEQELNRNRSISFGIILFPGFEPLDVYGPLEILYSLSRMYNMTASYISFATGPVSARVPPYSTEPGKPPQDSSRQLGPSTVATHTFADAPPLDVILVPGGMGNRALEQANDTRMEDFLARRANQTDYLLSVCSGAVTLARAGLLGGRRATTTKMLWPWITDPHHGGGGSIRWVPSARWVQDGQVWTSSGVAAGMDMMYAFAKHLYGAEHVDMAVNNIEYAPHQDPDWDPFSVLAKVPGADTSRSMKTCVSPAGPAEK